MRIRTRVVRMACAREQAVQVDRIKRISAKLPRVRQWVVPRAYNIPTHVVGQVAKWVMCLVQQAMYEWGTLPLGRSSPVTMESVAVYTALLAQMVESPVALHYSVPYPLRLRPVVLYSAALRTVVLHPVVLYRRVRYALVQNLRLDIHVTSGCATMPPCASPPHKCGLALSMHGVMSMSMHVGSIRRDVGMHLRPYRVARQLGSWAETQQGGSQTVASYQLALL